MLVKLIALATLAVLGSTVAPLPANALSVESHNFVRNANVARHHAVVSKRQATTRPRRCKARTTSLAGSSSASTAGQSSPSTTPRTSSSGGASTRTSTFVPAPTTTHTTQLQTSVRTSSTKAATSNAPAPTPGTGGKGKACVTYSGNVNVVKFVSDSSKIGCVINWSSWKPSFMSQLPGVQFIPMHWGSKQNEDTRKNVVAGFAQYVLGMNEPNQDGQSMMSPADGVGLWRAYVEPLHSQGYQLISPAPTNAPSGQTWLQSFLDICSGCHVYAIAAHWYGTDVEALIGHVTNYHNAFGRPIWLTEFACHDFSGRNQQCSSDKTWSFLDRAQSFMDNTSWVHRYAWFGALQYAQLGGVNPVNRLINDDSSPSALGLKYLGYA